MTTGILGAIVGGATLIYTAPVDAKLMITGATSVGGGSAQVNGNAVFYVTPAQNGAVTHFVGAGQTVNINNNGGIAVVVSVLEGT